jgi:hypothetical protein
MDVIWVNREGIYFCSDDWTGSISLSGLENFAVWRKGSAPFSVAVIPGLVPIGK